MTVPTITAHQQLVGYNPTVEGTPPPTALHVQGALVAGDGGGGAFFWDPASMLAEDGGTVRNPGMGGAPGRWRRICEPGVLHASWFGVAAGNADNLPTLNLAIAAAAAVNGIVVLPAGRLSVVGTIVLPANVWLRGAGITATQLVQASATPMDLVQTSTTSRVNASASANNRIEDLQLVQPTYARWVAGAVDSTGAPWRVGGFYAPADPSNVVLELVSGSGSTGPHTPLGQLTPTLDNVLLLAVPMTPPTHAYAGVLVKFTVAGALGAAQYEYSLDNGATWNGAALPTTPNAYNDRVYCSPNLPDYLNGGLTGYSLQLTDQVGGYSTTGTLAPNPPVWLTGTPSAEWTSRAGAAIDVQIVAGGTLGAMTLAISTTGSPKAVTTSFGAAVASAAGTVWTYPIPGTGLTLNCGAGTYSPGIYTSPSFAWSMVPGTLIQDGSYTWRVHQGPACYADLTGVNVLLRQVSTLGGSVGILFDGTEGGDAEHVSCGQSSLAGVWVTGNADHSPGQQGGFTNGLSLHGVCNLSAGGNGYGIVDDGGAGHSIHGPVNFEGNSAGWAYFAGLLGASIHGGVYLEDAGAIARSVSCCSRRLVTAEASAIGLSVTGIYAGSIEPGGLNGGVSVIDFSPPPTGFFAAGNQLSGSVAGFTGFAGSFNPCVDGGNAGPPTFDAVTVASSYVGSGTVTSAAFKCPQRADNTVVMYAPGGAFAIAGIGNAADGRRLRVVNPSGQAMTLKHQDSSDESVAANRICCPGAVDLVLAGAPSSGFTWVDLEYVTAEKSLWPASLPYWLVTGHS